MCMFYGMLKGFPHVRENVYIYMRRISLTPFLVEALAHLVVWGVLAGQAALELDLVEKVVGEMQLGENWPVIGHQDPVAHQPVLFAAAVYAAAAVVSDRVYLVLVEMLVSATVAVVGKRDLAVLG